MNEAVAVQSAPKAQAKPKDAQVKPDSDREAAEKAEREAKRAHIREQLLVLMAASFCSKPHGAKLQRGASALHSKALEERRKQENGATVYEGDRNCAECQKKLAPMSAALVLALLPTNPTDKLVHAAKELRAAQPMTWHAILMSSPMHLDIALRRQRTQHFTAAEYQAMASELLSALRD